MTGASADACRRALDEAQAAGGAVAPATLAVLAAAPADALDLALRAFADAHGDKALGVLATLGAAPAGGVRRGAKRALYRLAQRGITPPPKAAPRPVVERHDERPLRAWISAIDGSGSRATWLLFDGAYGGLELCSLIVNDVAGVLEVAGGGITKKRLEAELAALRAAQKLPWVETEPARAIALIAEALRLHASLGTSPPSGFARWQRHFDGVTPPDAPALPREPDASLVARGGELLDAPEMAGWFLEPADVQSNALELLQADESRLVVSDQVKAERAESIVTRVVERELGEEARRRWARRLVESAFIFDATDRGDLAAVARASAGALVGAGEITSQPFARTLARRALDVAGEVATGRLTAAAASRKPA
ncbi:MAG: hypothetical protein FJZ38_22725 [Candidatus Rokubacteria bacterium]|nr:hypothetical protein [Candidatus Rokubacteria bacterium]